MSASVGPQGGPRPPTAPAQSMPDMPDLSHLTEEERKIIMAVMVRQKEEEDKEQAMLKTLHQQFESYKEQVRRIGADTQRRRQQQQQQQAAPATPATATTTTTATPSRLPGRQPISASAARPGSPGGCGHLFYCRAGSAADHGGAGVVAAWLQQPLGVKDERSGVRTFEDG
ncbi:regulating synaptic membrane exocytosis protein 2-like [Alosa alosa]|uniref:regulating synaptic membrane exocytosis protein 2-like n=1 Tax=Alosa alosa TaxID=278164 RepID=UPI0020152567|nr:regulating synaptic membrane exocytosis protein 2-like [Alosa alosa]